MIFLPVLAALILSFVKTKNEKNYFNFGLLVCFVNFVISAKLFFDFDQTIAGFQYKEVVQLLNNLSFKYYLGIDGIAVAMIILTTFLTPICLLISYNTIKYRVKEFVIFFLLIQ